MAGTRTLEIRVVGNATDAQRMFAQLPGEADKAGNGIVTKLKGSFAGFGSSIATGVFGGLAADRLVQGAVSFVKGALAEAEESLKVSAETKRVIETTGGAANVTAKDVDKLSSSLSRKVAVDDQVIQNGANVLLTFTKVRNEVGKGNDIYNQGVKLSLDMSKALGTDFKGSLIQVGKALNDPIRGMTALSRSGVSFTEQQKEQIRTLVESGDVLGAQKVILGELKTEFQGAAAAAVTPADRMKVAWANIKEEVGLKLMPVLATLTTWFLNEGLPAIQSFVGWVQANWPKFQQAFEVTWAVVKPILENIWGRIKAVADIVAETVQFVTAIFNGEWAQAWEHFKGLVGAGLDYVWHAFLELPAKVMGVLLDLAGQAIGWAAELPGKLLGALGDLGGDIATSILNGFKAAWNGVANAVNDAIPNSIGFDGPFGIGFSVNLPDNPIPRLDRGGIVKRTGLAIVHEGEEWSGVGAARRPLGSRMGGGGIVINNYATIMSDRQMIDLVRDGILEADRRNGRR